MFKHLTRAAATAAVLTLGGCCVAPSSSDTGMGGPDAGPQDTGLPPPDGGPMDATAPDAGPMARLPTNGAPIAVSRDDRVAVVVNKNVGRNGGAAVEKYRIDRTSNPPVMTFTGSTLLPDVTQVIIGADDDTAFAAGNGVAIKIAMLKASNQLLTMQQATIGNEARGLALSPSGSRLYVANWADGTVHEIATVDMSVQRTIDLNPALASSGVLGDRAVTLQRPGLAHPHAIAVTDDGDEDDDDETVYVTEYFSQARVSGVPADDSGFDLGRQGVVYRFSAGDRVVQPLITLTPRMVSDPGLVDANDATTACFPNLLSAATVHGDHLYVTGTCASPRGPMGPVVDMATGLPSNTQNFKTLVHGALFVVDTRTNLEDAVRGLLLTRELLRHYATEGTPDDASRRMPLLPSGVSFVPDSDTAYITAYGADAVFRLDFDAGGMLASVGSAGGAFVDLAGGLPGGAAPGRLPLGLAISTAGDMAFVVNENTRNVSFIALPDDTVAGTAELRNANPMGTESNINEGRRFFVTGLGRWSYRGQAWSSCESCHPNGLSDGVTWFTPRGPRQTIGLDGSFHPTQASVQRLFGWNANLDEVHDFELFTRDVSGGVGALVHATSATEPPLLADRIHFTGTAPTPAGQVATATPQDGLNGSTSAMMPGGTVTPRSVIDDWNKVQAFVAQVRSPRAPSNINGADAMAGRQLFVDHFCTACHATEQWTISRRFYTPSETVNNPTTGLLVTTDYLAPMTFPAALNPATDNGTRTAPIRTFDALNDQIACALRAVGTFDVAASGVRLREVRDDMTTPAQGGDGYNVPSLLGVGASAPYFHAGNARTLEELFEDDFMAHHATVSPSFPGSGDRATLIAQLVAFLLSIEDRTMVTAVPQQMDLGYTPIICPPSL